MSRSAARERKELLERSGDALETGNELRLAPSLLPSCGITHEQRQGSTRRHFKSNGPRKRTTSREFSIPAREESFEKTLLFLCNFVENLVTMPLPPNSTKLERKQHRQAKRDKAAAKLLALAASTTATLPSAASPLSTSTKENKKKLQKSKDVASVAPVAVTSSANALADQALRLKKSAKKEKAKLRKLAANSTSIEMVSPRLVPLC